VPDVAAQTLPAAPAEAAPETQPTLPEAAQPTAPPAYVEPPAAAPDISAQTIPAPTPSIDETLVTAPKSKLPSYIMWGVGGASLVAGAVLGITAITAKSDFDKNPTYDGADRVEGRSVAADVAFGLSAVMLITGTAFYFMPDSTEARPTASNAPKPASARLHVTPLLGRTTGGALSLEF
jgi:hypothetical protein